MAIPPQTTPNPQHHIRSMFDQGTSSATNHTPIRQPSSPSSGQTLQMNTTASPSQAPTSALPNGAAVDQDKAAPRQDENDSSQPSSSSSSSPFATPKLRLEIRDLSHPGAAAFLTTTNAAAALAQAASSVQRHLYSAPRDPTTHCPPTRSVTLILRPMPGVAHTTGVDLDPEHHKEIHFSLNYIAGIKSPDAASGRSRDRHRAEEIAGVLTHEMVHCYQWNGRGSCPGGLVEGVADWVRLRCGLAPPHWKRGDPKGGKWDAGYQHTAYFLDYLEERFGDGSVRRLNERLRGSKYEEKEFWPELFGETVDDLWGAYCDKANGKGEVSEGSG